MTARRDRPPPPWRHLPLLAQLVRRDVAARYRGSWLGLGWSLLQPLLLLAVYTFVFGMVFPSRWPQAMPGQAGFAAALYCGLLPFSVLAECLARAPGLVLNHPNYVKKVVFPLALLAWVPLGTALYHAGLGLLLLLAYLSLTRAGLGPALLTLPLLLVPLAGLCLGCGWGLSALGIYLRDVGQVVGLGTTLLLFLSPVFYPLAAVPVPYRDWLALNPLTALIEQTRAIVLWQQWPDPGSVGALWLGSGLIAAAGYAFFERTRRGFADVL
ncbi:MAG: ABC transporter permease [Candidatus Sericytochromatia bacterium]|nr:ABC transporter permease [Candidatus Sericytochromatia bacterium]